MSARDAFEFSTLHKGSGVNVLLVEFHALAVDDFHSRLKMLSDSRLIARVDSTPLMGAPWVLETFRHRLVFVRLREQHMYGARGEAMGAFLAQLAASPAATVIPVVNRRAVLDQFRHHLCGVSPMYLDTSFLQEDLLHILGAYALSKPVRRRTSGVDLPRELSLAGL